MGVLRDPRRGAAAGSISARASTASDATAYGSMKILTGLGALANVVLAVLVVLFIFDVINPGDGDGPASERPSDDLLLDPGEGAPREFLYLDAARTDAYLSQFQGGLATLEKTSSANTDKRTAALEGAPAKISREMQAQESFERQVTPTNASRFISLGDYLERDRTTFKDLGQLPIHQPASPQAIEARAEFMKKWSEDVKEGDFVRFEGEVRLPRFMRLYQTIRQVPADSPIGKQGKPVSDAIGLDPRFPFTVTVDHDGKKLRLIFPAQYSAVATESSLFYGRLTVIGKVVYRIYPARRAYRDLQTYSRFRPILSQRRKLDRLLTRLRLDADQLRAELLRYRTVQGPAAIILPVAIYK